MDFYFPQRYFTFTSYSSLLHPTFPSLTFSPALHHGLYIKKEDIDPTLKHNKYVYKYACTYIKFHCCIHPYKEDKISHLNKPKNFMPMLFAWRVKVKGR